MICRGLFCEQRGEGIHADIDNISQRLFFRNSARKHGAHFREPAPIQAVLEHIQEVFRMGIGRAGVEAVVQEHYPSLAWTSRIGQCIGNRNDIHPAAGSTDFFRCNEAGATMRIFKQIGISPLIGEQFKHLAGFQ